MLKRRNSTFFIVLLGALVLLTNCNKKDIELEIIETACKDFFVDNGQYLFDTTGSCDENLRVSFDFDGDEECLFQARVTPKFYDINGNEFTGFDRSSQLYLIDEGELTVSGNTATFQMCIEYPAGFNEDELNYMQVDFNSENEQTNESNVIGVRANLPGSKVKQPTSNDYDRKIDVKSNFIQINLIDDAAEDGDIISINVNNEWVIENKMILNAGETVSVPVNIGENFIMFYAVNQGSSGPNTLAGTIEDGVQEPISFDVNLNTGQVSYYRINYIPTSN